MGSVIDGVLPEFMYWASHDSSVRRLLVIIGKTGGDSLGLIMPFLQDCDTGMSGPPAFRPRSPKSERPFGKLRAGSGAPSLWFRKGARDRGHAFARLPPAKERRC